MNILIVEDERPAAEKLKEMISCYNPSFKVVAALDSVEETIEWLSTHPKPDLLFLDIHLSDGISFEIFKELSVSCPIIFITAYDGYALEAFKVNSIDYLLKPITAKALAQSFAKYEALKRNFSAIHFREVYENMDKVNPFFSTPYKSRFLVKYGQKIKSISTEDTAYFVAEDKSTLLVTYEHKSFVIDFTLDHLEELLDPSLFFRLNRKIITHLSAIKEIHTYYKGRLKIMLQPAYTQEVVVSSERVNAFKEWLDS